MYFETVQAALAMDGHGVYVWAAYGVTAFCLSALLLRPVLANRRLLQVVRQRSLRQQSQRAAPAPVTGEGKDDAVLSSSTPVTTVEESR